MKYREVRLRRARPRYLLPGLCLAAGGLILSGCPGGAELENAEDHLLAGSGEGCDALPIFEQKCSSGICHELDDDGSAPSGGVDLLSPGVAGRLLNVAATYPDVDGCPTPAELLIDGSNWEASLLWKKLTDTQTCGDPMPTPYSVSALNDRDMACVRSWIQGVIVDGSGAGTGGTTGVGTGGAESTGGTDGVNTGGTDTAGTGGSGATPETLHIEAECAHGVNCNGITGSNSGESMLENDMTTIGYIGAPVTLTYAGIMANGHSTLTLNQAKGNTGGTMEIHLGTADGELIGTATPPGTGDWTVFEELEVVLSAPLTGTQTLVFVAVGESVLNLDWFELSAGSN